MACVYSKGKKKGTEKSENQANVGEDINQLGENQYAYQEPLQQIDQHPVRIFNQEGESTAVFEVCFRNKYEKFMTISRFMDYGNILIKTQDEKEEIYFQTMSIRKSFRTYKWEVFFNGEYHAILEMESGMKNLKRGLEFKCFYHVQGKTYVLKTSKFGTYTSIHLKGEGNSPVLHCERSFIGIGKKGRDENIGRRHLLHDLKDEELSLVEKAVIYQQVISRIEG